MDLGDTPSEAAFRQRLIGWLKENMPNEPLPKDVPRRHAFLVGWHKRLHAGGWVGLSWPRDYGGQGLGPIEEAIFNEEMGRANAPKGPELGYIGRPILAFGSEKQKRRYLPPMLGSTELWCQGFSEPEAGSDLANLQTRAVQDGSRFRVTGHKVWTSYAQFADYCFLLARTGQEGPKHRGISAFIVDMGTQGISVKPITQITGDEEFCEIFFDETPVPRENLVGKLNDGWRLAMHMLAYERGPVDVGWQAHFRVLLNRLSREVRDRGREEDTRTREAIATAAVWLEVLRLHCLRTLTRRAQGHEPGAETSLDKILMAATEQKLLEVAMDVLKPEPLLADDEWFNAYLFSRAATILGGTAQIQKNIVATRLLGLPR